MNKRFLRTAVLLTVIMATSTMVHAAPPPLKTKNEDARAAYRDGHAALNRGDWGGATQTFRRLERALQRTNESLDAALYWQAYALSRMERHEEARKVARRLIETYPQSPWRDDARRIVRAKGALSASALGAREEDDVMMALDALLGSNSPRAVPLLQKLLAGDHSDKVKARALFVLSQLDAKSADEALQTILRQKGSAALKEKALRMIAAGGRSESLLRLEAVYESDPSLRRAVIQAWIIGGRKDLLLRTAKGENDKKLRASAIRALGALNGRDELMALYRTFSKEDDRRRVPMGLGIAGATEELATVAKNDRSL
ncbi:MAG: tetratricopeptide repeat protein, partial [Myxococcota bacterium]